MKVTYLLPIAALLASLTTCNQVVGIEDQEMSDILELANLDVTSLLACPINQIQAINLGHGLVQKALWIKNQLMNRVNAYTVHFQQKDKQYLQNMLHKTKDPNLLKFVKQHQSSTRRLAIGYYLFEFKKTEKMYESIVELTYTMEYNLKKAMQQSCPKAQLLLAQYIHYYHILINQFAFKQIQKLQYYTMEHVSQRTVNTANHMDFYSNKDAQHAAIQDLSYSHADYMVKKAREMNQVVRSDLLTYVAQSEAQLTLMKRMAGVQ